MAQARPCHGRVLAVSWPLATHPCLLCHNTIPLYRDPNWKLGNSPFQLPATSFFFFPHSSYSKTTQYIYIYIYIYIQTIISRLTLDQAMRAHALPHAPRVGRSYRGSLMVVLWRRLGHVMAESWPYRGP